MPDPETFWLTITNVVLGVGVGLCVLSVAIGVGREILVRRKQVGNSHEIEDNLRRSGDNGARRHL